MLASAIAPSIARAAPSSSAEVRGPRLSREAALSKARADAAMDAGRYADALAAYRDAYANSHSATLLYNMGSACQRLGQYPEALAHLEQFARTADADLKAKVPRLSELLAEVRSHLAAISVRANIAGAHLLVRGKWVATTPVRGVVFTLPGAADIELVAEGHAPYKIQLRLVEGRSVEIAAALTRVPVKPSLPATLVVRTSASDGDVCIDAVCLGLAPVTKALAAGSHTVVLRAPGHEQVTASTVLASGQSKELFIEPAALPQPITTKWWFWAGVGVVVVSGIALTAVLLTDHSPRGEVAPGSGAASLLRF